MRLTVGTVDAFLAQVTRDDGKKVIDQTIYSDSISTPANDVDFHVGMSLTAIVRKAEGIYLVEFFERMGVDENGDPNQAYGTQAVHEALKLVDKAIEPLGLKREIGKLERV